MQLEELRDQFPSAPEYLIQIFFIERDDGIVPNAKLASRLDVSRPAVSQATKRLKKLKLVEESGHGMIVLTAIGRTIAEKYIRRHFLLEHLLVGVLEYPWDNCDKEAARLQVALSETLTEHLDKHLHHPQTCPHGNPMPGSPLEQRYLEALPLSHAEENSVIRIMRITEEGEMLDNLLTFCEENNVKPGRVLKVQVQTQHITYCLDESEKREIPKKFGAHIRCEPV